MGKYKTYEKYKSSGVKWLGEIPEHWNVRKLKFISALNMGQSTDSTDYNYDSAGVPFLQGKAEFGEIHPKPYLYTESAKKFALKGDILLSVRAPVGDLNIANQKYGIGRGLCAIRPLEKVFSSFLRYFLEVGKHELLSVATGSTYEAVSISQVANMLCLLPPIEEQKSIAHFLDRETARIDTLITKKCQLIDLLQKKRNSIINEAVTIGLDFDVDLKDSGIPFIGKIPKHWKAIRLKFAVTHIVDCLHSTPKYDENGDYPAIRTSDISPGILDIGNANRVNTGDYLERIARLKPEAQDIIYSREGERFGMAALVPEGVDLCLAQRVMMFRVAQWVDPTYFMWVLNADCMYHQVKQDTVGATSPRVNIGTIVEAWLPIPPKNEQKEIGLKISESCLQIDKIIGMIQEHILMLEKCRQSLITAAVTGKIDVREELIK